MKIRICAMFLTGFVWSTKKQIRICSNGMMPMLTADTVNLPRMFRQWEILLHEGWLWKVSDGVYEENGTYVADQMETGGLYDEDWLADTDGNNSGRAERQITTNNIRQNLATQVANWLGNENTYNLYLNHIPQGKDTIAYFLETGHEGYCMHFASAGALILQSLGVPARYASGYVVEPSAFHKEKKGYQADVPDYNAHAWVEIYLENIGWVPVEMTPGYTNDSAKLPTTTELRDTL